MLDTNIPLSVQMPKMESPLSMFANVMQIRNQQQVAEQNAIQLQQLRQAQADDAALRDSVKRLSTPGQPVNLFAVADDLNARGFAPVGEKVRTSAYAAAKSVLENSQKASENLKRDLGMASSILLGAKQEGGTQQALDRARSAIGATNPNLLQYIPKEWDAKVIDGLITYGMDSNARLQLDIDARTAEIRYLEYQRNLDNDTRDLPLKQVELRQKALETAAMTAQTWRSQEDMSKSLMFASQFAPVIATVISEFGGRTWQETQQNLITASQKPQTAAEQETSRHNRVEEGLSSQRLGLERERLRQADPFGNSTSQPGAPTDKATGEDVLRGLPEAESALVKALAEGRKSFPGSFALRSPYWVRILGLVARYDPSFDEINYNSRYNVRKDFTSGKAAEQVTSLNRTIGHLSYLSDAVQALDNSDVRTWNRVANKFKTEFGWTGQTNFETISSRVAQEVTRLWRGTGGNESDIKRDLEVLTAAASPAQLHGAIANIAALVESQLESLQKRYTEGVGTADVNMLSGKSRTQLGELGKRGGMSLLESAPPPASSSLPANYDGIVVQGGVRYRIKTDASGKVISSTVQQQ